MEDVDIETINQYSWPGGREGLTVYLSSFLINAQGLLLPALQKGRPISLHVGS